MNFAIEWNAFKSFHVNKNMVWFYNFVVCEVMIVIVKKIWHTVLGILYNNTPKMYRILELKSFIYNNINPVSLFVISLLKCYITLLILFYK